MALVKTDAGWPRYESEDGRYVAERDDVGGGWFLYDLLAPTVRRCASLSECKRFAS